MANEKMLNTRIQHKIDTAAHWELATNFKPLEGEIIIYSDLNKIKIGDGKTNVNDLDFISAETTTGAGSGSAVIGSGSASGANSTVIGGGTASGVGATVIGSGLAEGDNSLAFNNAIAYSSNSVAMGNDSKSGCKGFYWYDVITDDNGVAKGMRLTLKQNELYWPHAGSDEQAFADTALEEWVPGDVVSYTNGTRYVLKSTIDYVTTYLNTGIPVVFFTEELPFTTKDTEANLNDKSEFSITNPRKPEAGMIPFAEGAFSAGINNSAAGTASISLGQNNLSAGEWSYTEGHSNTAVGTCSHAEGYNTIAGNGYSHAEGYGTEAIGSRGSHAEGWETHAIGNASHAEGRDTEASGLYAHAEGGATYAMALRSHAEGHETIASGDESHAEGSYTEAIGLASHTEGNNTTADGDYSHAEGNLTNASGKSSHAEGNNTTASGEYSHAEGDSTEASGKLSHAEGYDTTASGVYSHAEGYKTQAIKNYTHAEGRHTIANADDTHVEGRGTVATYNNQHVQGKYNYLDENGHSGDYAHVVGWGTEANRKNIYTLSTKGDGSFAGNIYADTVHATTIHGFDTLYTEGNISVGSGIISEFLQVPNGGIKINTEDIATKQEIVGKKITNGGEVFNNYETSLAIGANSHIEGAGPTSQNIALTGEANATTYEVASNKIKNFAVNDWYKKDNGVIVYVLSVDKTNNTITVSETLSNTAITNKSFTRYRGGLASGPYAHVEGRSNIASGNGSHAEGNNVVASGNYSHAEGDNQTTASGIASHAEGYGTMASGDYSHAEGISTAASGKTSHAEGDSTTANGISSHAEGGYETIEYEKEDEKLSQTFYTEASGKFSHAEGAGTKATNTAAHSEGGAGALTGYDNDYSDVELRDTVASGEYSHAEGVGTAATNYGAHAEGLFGEANGVGSHVEGCYGEGACYGVNNIASGDGSHSEGAGTWAIGFASHAEGGGAEDIGDGLWPSIAYGDYSHVEGYMTQTGEDHTDRGIGAHAEGVGVPLDILMGDFDSFGYDYDCTTAVGNGSHAEGLCTVAYGDYQHTQGRFNEIDYEGKYAHIVGNGGFDENEDIIISSNAHTLDWDGNAWFAGNVTVGKDKKELATKEYVDENANGLFEYDDETGYYATPKELAANSLVLENGITAHHGYIDYDFHVENKLSAIIMECDHNLDVGGNVGCQGGVSCQSVQADDIWINNIHNSENTITISVAQLQQLFERVATLEAQVSALSLTL